MKLMKKIDADYVLCFYLAAIFSNPAWDAC
jgi:hypothetical protein